MYRCHGCLNAGHALCIRVAFSPYELQGVVYGGGRIMRFLLPQGGTKHANQQLALIGCEMEVHALRLGLIRQDDWCGLSAETMRVFRGKSGRHQE